MSYKVIILFIYLHTSFAFAENDVRIVLRNSFHSCTTKESTEAFDRYLFASENKDIIFIGYRGAVTAMKAQYVANPLRKYNLCKEGIAQISEAILNSPADLELRYLRLMIESNIPSFLGMNDNLKGDKDVILKTIDQEKDLHLKKMISAFLLKGDLCTDEEKKMLALR